VIDAANPALHKAPESLNGIGVNVSVHVLSGFVPDLIVPIHALPIGIAHCPKPLVTRIFVGVHDSARNDVLGHDAHNLVCSDIGKNSRNDFALSLDNADHGNLGFVSAHRSASSVLALATIVGFVDLGRRPLQLQIAVRHQGPNLLEHAPSGFVGNSSLALNLLCGDSATSRAHQVRSIKPQPKRSGRLLKNGPGQWIDVASAVIASISSAASHAIVLPILLALLAIGDAARKALLFDVFKACRVIRKLFVEDPNAIAKLFWYVLFDSHDGLIVANSFTCCQGILTSRLIGTWHIRSGVGILRIESILD